MKNFPREIMHSNGVPMLLDSTRLMLSFQRPLERSEVIRFLASLDLFPEDEPDPEQSTPGEIVNQTSTRYFVQSRRPITDQRFDVIEKAALAFGVEFIAPVYRLAGEQGRRALLAPLPNVVVVRLRERDGAVPQLEGPVIAAQSNLPAPRLQEVPEKSRYLNGFRYYIITNVREVNAYQLRARLLADQSRLVLDVQFEIVPLIRPTAVEPTDVLYTEQWDMERIGAGGLGTTGWDLAADLAGVIVAVLDEGVDLAHPDLRFAASGINLGTISGTGAPTGNHGTAVAGIIAALFNNGLGIAGVAGGAALLPIAFQTWSDVEVAMGINYARINSTDVINMSFGFNGWSRAIIDPAIAAAFAADIVMVVATHNYNGAITYPATNPLVIAVGATDKIDNRKTPSSPDLETWGSNYGAQISVVAPGVLIPTTDRNGPLGYNTNFGLAGDYTLTFNGTSAATPHVAGLVALVRALYPALTNVQVRTLIERTAEKVGTVPYAVVAGYPNGSWNQEMGYGRINILRALDFADLLVKDAPGDTGVEPFTGGNFWDFSDIVVRITDDGVFVPSDPLQSKNVEQGQPNYIYVRVTNNGPRAARNVTVTARITPYVGLEFVYPQDWTLADTTHIVPNALTTNFALIPAGASVFAKFRIEAAQTDTLYGWVAGQNWHPCLLVAVNAENDYAFGSALLAATPPSPRLNNLAQRNLSVINVLAGARATFPFIAGSRFNPERSMTLLIDRSHLPGEQPLLLSLDDDGSAFPLVDFAPPQQGENDPRDEGCGASALVFLETTRVQTTLGCASGILTLAKGSRFDCAVTNQVGQVTVEGGDVIVRGNRRYVQITAPQVRVHIRGAPNAIYAMSLQTVIPAIAADGGQYQISVAQLNSQGVAVGGAAVVYVVQA